MSITQETFQSETAYVVRNEGVDLELKLFMDEQIEYILKHRATEHPFLNAYAEHGLPPEQSQVLYLETLHYFKYLPFYVCGISTITRDEAVLRTIAFNARDELGKPIPIPTCTASSCTTRASARSRSRPTSACPALRR